jgi:hypothetical protein
LSGKTNDKEEVTSYLHIANRCKPINISKLCRLLKRLDTVLYGQKITKAVIARRLLLPLSLPARKKGQPLRAAPPIIHSL